MTAKLIRTALIMASCTGLVACSQPGATSGGASMAPVVNAAPPAPTGAFQYTLGGVGAASATGTKKAAVCTVKGAPASAGVSTPWSISVSSGGGACAHSRELERENNTIYGVKSAPAHGQITQQPQGPKTYIIYTPTPGYTGPDTFTMRAPRAAIDMPYSITVVP